MLYKHTAKITSAIVCMLFPIGINKSKAQDSIFALGAKYTMLITDNDTTRIDTKNDKDKDYFVYSFVRSKQFKRLVIL